jgi:hypothetical protein
MPLSDDRMPPFIDMTVTVEDLQTGDEVELPPVRLVRTKMDEEPESDPYPSKL